MKDTVVFLGPTMSIHEAKSHLDALYLPPAKQGDVYSAYLKYRPQIIGMIDGNFENVPSPWHKELLYVISHGVHVLGSSSMGALRAAELSHYGMIGCGKIYDAFKSGELGDDDEVAILHGPACLGYPYLSEAMVNIRSTLESAYLNNVISKELHNYLVIEAKKTFYKERKYSTLIKQCSNFSLFSEEIEHFKLWLETGHIDQKKADAIVMFKVINQIIYKKIKPEENHFEFENTMFWQGLKSEIEAR